MRLWNSSNPICHGCVEYLNSLNKDFQIIKESFLTLEATRFTEEQKNTIDQIIKFLGQYSLNHMIAVFSKCRKAPTINPDQLFDSLVPEQKTFLSRIDNRFIISPDLDVFDEPDDPIVANHMINLKNYIIGIPNFYTAAAFEKVYITRERELQQKIDENKHSLSNNTISNIPAILLVGKSGKIL